MTKQKLTDKQSMFSHISYSGFRIKKLEAVELARAARRTQDRIRANLVAIAGRGIYGKAK